MKKLTTIEFIEKAIKIHGNKYDYSKVIYIRNNVKVSMICKNHGLFHQTPKSHLIGQGCPTCSGNIVLSKNTFISKSKLIHGLKYDYSNVNYVNLNTKVKLFCSIHGEFEQTPKNHINGHGCKFCSNNVKLTTKKFIERCSLIHENKYDYSLTKYKNINNKVKIVCPTHGEFEQIANLHVNYGSGCPKCHYNKISNIKKFTTNDFVLLANKQHGEKYDYSFVNYVSSHDMVKIICREHGCFEQKSYIHLNGSGCPICKESKGEKAIRIYLLNNKIEFKQQKRFKECRDKKPLPFDFYIPKYNICIEYDGIQHFKPIKQFGGEYGLVERKRKDEIKNNFCEKNNIKLIRVSYCDNVHEILKLIYE